MSYYFNWFKGTAGSSDAPSTNAIALQADLTPAQVTVTTVRDQFVYNMEYKPKPVSNDSNKPKPKNSEFRSRESTASSNTFAAANVVAARFQNRSRSHTNGHSRQESTDSTESQALFISEDSMWDDWILKYVNEDKKQTIIVDDAPMEDWIFEM